MCAGVSWCQEPTDREDRTRAEDLTAMQQTGGAWAGLGWLGLGDSWFERIRPSQQLVVCVLGLACRSAVLSLKRESLEEVVLWLQVAAAG